MYKVNENTKIGREIKNQIDNGIFKEYFEKSNVDISFLTTPNEKKSELNIHIYPENRTKHLKENFGRFTENDEHIPGCILNCIDDAITNNLISFENKIDKDEIINIEVIFGSKAASSRKEKSDTIEEYPLNSHVQLKDIEYLIQKKVNLKHSLDTSTNLTKIIINKQEFLCDTVVATAKVAINAAINLIYEKENIK
jgi:hypothetical protein